MKQKILSGIQQTGILTLGNYLGALRNWVDIQDEYDCMYFIADMHAITIPKDPQILRKNIKKALMQYIACGLDTTKNTIVTNINNTVIIIITVSIILFLFSFFSSISSYIL